MTGIPQGRKPTIVGRHTNKLKGYLIKKLLGDMPQGMSLILIKDTLVDPLTLYLYFRRVGQGTWKSCMPLMELGLIRRYS